MSLLDAPNQQVVRADGSGPGIEYGEPAAAEDYPEPQQQQTQLDDTLTLDEMTKEQLLEYAQNLGVVPANQGMNKEDLRAGIDAKLAEG